MHLVPDAIDDVRASFVEPVAAAIEASLQTESFAGGRSLVLGAGKLGLLVAQVLAARGDDVRVVCRNPRASNIVESLGLIPVAPPSAPRGCDLVVDATGDAEGLATALACVRPLGAIVMKSTIAQRHELDLSTLVINEVSLIGSRCGAFAPAIVALSDERLRVEPLLDEIRPLSDGLAAFERAGRPGALKLLLKPEG